MSPTQTEIEYVCKIIHLSAKLKMKGHHLLVEYAPHINAVSVRLYVNGWKELSAGVFTEPILDKTIYLSTDEGIKALHKKLIDVVQEGMLLL